jgi:nucleoside-diphosphate-sugar epimerase
VHVTVTGGLGFLGRLVARELVAGDHQVTLFDAAEPSADGPGASAVAGASALRGEITDPAAVGAALPEGTEAIVHLASMVSAECEREPERALRVNVGGLDVLLAAVRRLRRPPRLLFASSVAVFGALPDGVAGDATKHVPMTTYGVTKAIGELLVNEATRREWIDGRTARLPTVIIRPGRPNAAASSFASGLFREPLAGIDAVVPVELATPIVVVGHRAAVRGLMGLLEVDGAALGGDDRAVNLPGLETTVGEMVATCERRPEARGALSVVPDPLVQAVVGSWPAHWDAERAAGLGLRGDSGLDRIIDDYLADFS